MWNDDYGDEYGGDGDDADDDDGDDDDGYDDDGDDDDLVLQGRDAVPPVTPSTVDPGDPDIQYFWWKYSHIIGGNILIFFQDPDR